MSPASGSQDGIHISGRARVSGALAAGDHASATSHTTTEASAADPRMRELTRAVQALLAELAQLRAERPGAVPDAEAQDAERALAEVEAEAASARPQPGVLRRRIRTVTDALGGVSGLLASVAALEVAAEPVIRSLGG